jgi:hypothetical protein
LVYVRAGMSAAKAGAANTTQAAAPSRIFFMEVPRYRLDRQQPNNVASIWLLRGTVKHVCLHDVTAATRSVLFHVRGLSRSNLSVLSRG